jgi:hypothetical protein
MTTPKPYQPVPESEKPWLKLDGFQKTYFPLAWGKTNSYTLFTPSVDRFIITDHYDLWAMVETAKILTSKISPMIYVLSKPNADPMNITNCLEYTTRHKKDEPEYGGAGTNRHKQSASLKKIFTDNIIHAGLPADYSSPSRLAMLYRLQEYALFTLRCVYAINLANEYRNSFPEKEYVDAFFKDEFPADFKLMPDNTSAPYGIKHEIKNILYHSMTVEEALASIHEAWAKYSMTDVTGVRQHFYHIMGIVEPDATRIIGGPGQWNKQFHESTAWVM